MTSMQKFWKPGTIAPGVDIDRNDGEPAPIVFNPNSRLSLYQQRQRLPIYKCRDAFLYMVETYRAVVIVGQTGSGKTTQIPQYLHEAGWTAGNRMVACTQPRRIAAITVAQRVAEEMGCGLGTEVGYCVRFDEKWDPEKTRIKFVTDGMLLRETLVDPLLSRYGVIMLDEAHERSLSTDILIGLLKKIMKKRPDLRIVVSSATVNAELFRDFFNENESGDPKQDTASIVSVEGRMYPVEMHYREKPVGDYVEAATQTVMEIHTTQPPGDVLVFMTGQEEIETVCNILQERSASLPRRASTMQLNAVPMFAGLAPDEQLLAFQPPPRNTRKVVVATNIAETSITIEGIVYVVDCGFVKQRFYSARSGVDSLLVTPTSKASARQRAGRAGRVRPGKCYRLYTHEAYEKQLPDNDLPEMQRTNLEPVILQLKALGIDDVLHFDFLSPPPSEAMARALEVLFSLGALDAGCRLTKPVGQRIAEMPLSPAAARCLLRSADEDLSCSKEMLTIAAMLSVQGVWVMRRDSTADLENAKRKFAVLEGDQVSLLNVYNAYTAQRARVNEDPAQLARWCAENFLNIRAMERARFVRKQLRSYFKRYSLPVVSCRGNTLNLRKAIVSGFFAQAGKLQADGTYTTLKGSASMSIHPSSVLFRAAPPWVVYHDLLYTTKHFMRDVTPIEPEWLPEMAPQFYEYEQRTLVRNDAYINAPDRPLPKSGTAGVLKGPARPAGY